MVGLHPDVEACAPTVHAPAFMSHTHTLTHTYCESVGWQVAANLGLPVWVWVMLLYFLPCFFGSRYGVYAGIDAHPPTQHKAPHIPHAYVYHYICHTRYALQLLSYRCCTHAVLWRQAVAVAALLGLLGYVCTRPAFPSITGALTPASDAAYRVPLVVHHPRFIDCLNHLIRFNTSSINDSITHIIIHLCCSCDVAGRILGKDSPIPAVGCARAWLQYGLCLC